MTWDYMRTIKRCNSTFNVWGIVGGNRRQTPERSAAGCGLRAAGCGLRAAGCGLRAKAGVGAYGAGAWGMTTACSPAST